jgi:hypothetical protein
MLVGGFSPRPSVCSISWMRVTSPSGQGTLTKRAAQISTTWLPAVVAAGKLREELPADRVGESGARVRQRAPHVATRPIVRDPDLRDDRGFLATRGVSARLPRNPGREACKCCPRPASAKASPPSSETTHERLRTGAAWPSATGDKLERRVEDRRSGGRGVSGLFRES